MFRKGSGLVLLVALLVLSVPAFGAATITIVNNDGPRASASTTRRSSPRSGGTRARRSASSG